MNGLWTMFISALEIRSATQKEKKDRGFQTLAAISGPGRINLKEGGSTNPSH